ncbi:hypothetical protein [Salinibaculum salinum]|uniref:hypothetical protein n=1 Tax=Salinibaculum salinum TaxID=3131996 RepID=UPI0030EB68AA
MTEQDRIKIHRSDLNIVLNAIAKTEDEITVSHLSDKIGDLYTFEIGHPHNSTIRFEKTADEYGEARSTIMGKQAQSEVPEQSSYVRSFTTSVLDFANKSDLDNFISRYAGRDPSEGHRPVYGILDSNIIRWQLADSLGIEPNNTGLQGSLLVTGVRDELHRYGGPEKIKNPSELVDELHPNYERLFNQFKGQPREQRLGLEYYQHLDNQIYSEEITSEQGDASILEKCEEFKNNSGYDLLFFTNDRNAKEMAHEKNILGHLVEFSDSLPEETSASWGDFGLLLYVHAMLFGIIRLPKVDLYGVWQSGDDDTTGYLLVDCRSRNIKQRIRRDIAVLDTWSNVNG